MLEGDVVEGVFVEAGGKELLVVLVDFCDLGLEGEDVLDN